VAAAGPASVAVHDDGDVFREPRWIQPLENFCFLAVQPGRDCYVQSNLFRLLKLPQDAGGCNDTEEAWVGGGH